MTEQQTQDEVDLRDPGIQMARMYGSSSTQPRKQDALVSPLEEELRRRKMYPSSDLERERRERTFTEEEIAEGTKDLADPEARQRRMYPQNTTEPEEGDAETESTEAEQITDEGDDHPAEVKADVDPEVLSAYQKAAKELGIEPSAQQKLLDGILPTVKERQQAVLANLREGWVKRSQSDELLAGERGFDHNLGVARQALERFGTPALTTLLDETGLGDHPEMIRLLLKVSRRLGRN